MTIVSEQRQKTASIADSLDLRVEITTPYATCDRKYPQLKIFEAVRPFFGASESISVVVSFVARSRLRNA